MKYGILDTQTILTKYLFMSKALTKEQFIKAHSAYFQQIGFDVQFAGCMYYLLGLGLEDRLDYEREGNWLLSVNGKTGAVETEAAGFSAAFNESTHNLNDILIIRGISDKADVDKDDKWRQPASDNAAKVLKDFITKIFSRA